MANQNSSTTRRNFLATTGAAAAALATPRWALGAAATSPNESVRFGLIGCGVRSRAFIGRASAVCDPDAERLGWGVETSGCGASKGVADLRRLLDDPDLDAIVVAAPDHWHAPAALLAMDAGKHVYVEKPSSHNFRESQLLVEGAERTGLVVQHGTQQRSRPFTRDAVQAIREGVVGDVLVAKAWNIQHRGSIGHASPTAVPEGVDYDQWVGPAEWMPFQKNRFHKDWHWWRNFGTGDIGNDGAHELDYARWGLGVDTLPHKVSAIGGKYFYDDDQQHPDTATCVFEFAPQEEGGRPRQLIFEMRLWSTNYPWNCDSGAEFYGDGGEVFLSKRGKHRVRDEKGQTVSENRAERSKNFEHLENFFGAIRNGDKLNAPMTTAHHTVALIHLANLSLRVGRSLTIDPKTEQIVGDPEAADLLKRTYREGGHWAVPKGV
ncbi:1,5-anhydro-D-fructose reductase [Pseudobythopirellula maris]|uniref:1,5-anhydro-D-fructose reductase n=1 Tax=Pseudobythopirellula maris TaxID=2527991 RepID=A0A5C5ZVN7_9BACT|nr:Gfo/Idh/MocA family oxidoreductase [Pseudobythopirellula maris]TWT91077.1 1,5-anhydro-D-fructose reductase [Pseudobythopirellula maris]